MTATRERKKQLAVSIVQDLMEIIVKAHLMVQAIDPVDREVIKEDMAELGLKITHDLNEAIQ